jgi:hypothetical protein
MNNGISILSFWFQFSFFDFRHGVRCGAADHAANAAQQTRPSRHGSAMDAAVAPAAGATTAGGVLGRAALVPRVARPRAKPARMLPTTRAKAIRIPIAFFQDRRTVAGTVKVVLLIAL